MDFRVELFSARQKRAATMVVAALVLVGVAAVSALRPAPAAHTAAAVPSPSPPRPVLLSIAPESGSSLYAVVGIASGLRIEDPTRRLVRSTDAGRTWQTLHLPREAGAPASLELVPGTRDVVVSAFDDLSSAPRSGTLWRSGDGVHWARLDVPGRAFVLPQFLDRLHGYWSSAGTDFGVYATADGGQSWHQVLSIPTGLATLAGVALPAERAFALSATASAVFLVVTPRSGNQPAGRPQLFRSTDGGATWTAISIDLPDPAPGAFVTVRPPQIAPDGRGLLEVQQLTPSRTANAYFASAPSAFLSTDGGATWQGPRPLDFTTVTLGPGGWWAAQQDSLYFSPDQGATWANLNAKFPPGGSVGTLQFVSPRVAWSLQPTSPFALRSMDGGRTWTEVPGPGR